MNNIEVHKPSDLYHNDFSKSAPGLAIGAGNSSFKNTRTPNISVKDSFTKEDYDYFREEESIPVRPKDIMGACMQAYKKFSIVCSIVDLMSDFCCKGIDIVHPSPYQQKIGKEWFKRVNGAERSERIASMIIRTAAAPIKRNTGKISSDITSAFKAEAAVKSPVKLGKNEIPTEYIVMDPRVLEVVGGEFAPLIYKNKLKYQVRVPEKYGREAENTIDYDMYRSDYSLYLSNLNLSSNTKIVKLDPNYFEMLHYKKDDFQIWATPILYRLLDDLKNLEKLKLADRSALDGVISNVRLWTLGNLEFRIFPGKDAIDTLADMLMNNNAGGSLDLIWGPELTFKDSATDSHNFLGFAKYVPTLSNIYQGLGVPPTLTGIVGEAGQGFSNNFVALRVLLERLDYLRLLLKNFWEKELKIIQSIFGFREPFTVTFDSPNLFEDSAVQKLLLEMVDRNIISDEFMQDRVGAIPEVEKVRVTRENKLKDAGKLPEKLSPIIKPEPNVAPNGRPPGTKDSAKRKQKKVSPMNTKANDLEVMVWANEAQDLINDYLSEPYLKSKKKKNLRSLSAQDFSDFEKLKFNVLCSIEPLTKIDDKVIKASMKDLKPISQDILDVYEEFYQKAIKDNDNETLTVQKCRILQSMTYASVSV